MTFGAQFFAGQPDWVFLLIAFVCGLIGIFLAIFLQRLAIAVAGFLAGALFATNFVAWVGLSIPPLFPILLGGILGAILLSVMFDWALIFLSSVTGAIFIVQPLSLEPLLGMLAFVVLVVLGISVQSRILRPGPAPQER